MKVPDIKETKNGTMTIDGDSTHYDLCLRLCQYNGRCEVRERVIELCAEYKLALPVWKCPYYCCICGEER